MTPSEKLEQWKNEFHTDFAATEEQRDKSNEELRFSMIPGGQWEGYLEDSFENRAKMELDQASDYLYRTYSQWTENRIGVNYSPDDDATTDEDAELLDGLFRRDVRRRNGQSSIDSAVFEAMASGYGAFHIATEFEDEEDEENDDKCVVFSELSNAYATVVWDSASRRRDKADANRCTILIPHSKDGFERKYPDINPDGSLQPQDRRWFNWTTPQIVYVAHRYEVREERDIIHVWGNPITQEMIKLSAKELEEERDELLAAGFEELRVKRMKRRNVYVSKFCGSEVIEDERRIAGKYIPVIPIYGYSAHIDGVDYWHGVVRKRMDGQRLLNMTASLMAEAAASSSEDKPIFTPAQMANPAIKQQWAKDKHQVPYLLADAIYDEDGKVTHAGPVGTLKGATQSVAAQTLLETVRQLIQQGTGGAPQDTLDTEASGKAINAILKRVDMNTQPIFDNIAAAIRHAGEVYRHIAAEIYSERPRGVKIVDEKGEARRVRLLQAVARNGAIVHANDPSKGRFEVIVDTGPAYHTQREETVVALKDILQALPDQDPLARIVLARIIEMLPSQGLDDIKEYVRKQLLIAGVAKPETPEEAQMLQQLAQQQGQGTGQDELIAAAAQNQRMEAVKRGKELEEIDAEILAKNARAAEDFADARTKLFKLQTGNV